MDLVVEAQNCLESNGHCKRLEEEVMREARVLRGKAPLIYPGNPRPGHV
jgi:hypothetical protein